MIELFPFQEKAADTIAERFMAYHADPVVHGTKQHPRTIPLFQALASVTASGKTVILADAVSTITTLLATPPLILWLSKGRVVVDQTYANLLPGGKYYHLLGECEVRTLAEYDNTEVRDIPKPLVFFATVGTFNQKDKEQGSRLIFKSDIDTANQSTWEALKERPSPGGGRRPLLVVYDEAHNLSDQQTNLLAELNPDAFLLASATMRMPQRLMDEVNLLKQGGWGDDRLVTTVEAKEVADSGLIKSTLVLAGYRAPMEETVTSLLTDMRAAEAEAESYGLEGKPKAIYVCRTNIIEGNAFQKDDPSQPFSQRQAPPILIWRYLVENLDVDPDDIAVYCSLTFRPEYPPPTSFHLFKGGDSDYADFTQGDYHHIIFNLSLQEGWDDPLCYFAYVDKSMDSRIQVEQIIGRTLRQPQAQHFSAERLNTAHFYVRVDRNLVFNEIIDEVSQKLAAEAPTMRIIKAPPGKPAVREYKPKYPMTVAETAYIVDDAKEIIETLVEQMTDYRQDTGVNTHSVGSRRVSTYQIGEAATTTGDWQDYEQTNLVSARWVFQREVRRRLQNALGVAPASDPKFDALIGVGSKAFVHISDAAAKVVEAFIDNVYLRQRKVDPYEIGPLLAREEDVALFQNAVHDGYSDLNKLELPFARALDRTGLTWCRNPSRIGYGIPLVTLGPTNNFYPDFLVWQDQDVIAIDTTGGHLLPEKVVRKLLRIEPAKGTNSRLTIRFVSEGRRTPLMEQEDPEGFTIWGLKPDNSRRVRHVGDLDEAVATILKDSQ